LFAPLVVGDEYGTRRSYPENKTTITKKMQKLWKKNKKIKKTDKANGYEGQTEGPKWQ
jgi:ligand-binding sensor protein